ncbi:hypothetical protein WJX77_011919 [Trebouxia sp. C0004]
MFLSPALGELIEPSSDTASGEPRPLPSSIHDPPSMDEYDSRTGPDGHRSASPSELDAYQRDLARQLAGVDEQTFQRVKQAIQTVLNQRQESTHQQSLIESARERVQQALHGSSMTESDDSRGAFSTIADAVASAGNAIGQLSSQILGGGEIQGEVADEEAGLRAEEAVQPLRDWQQGRQSTQGSTGSTYTQQEQQTGPKGFFSREAKSAQDAGPGNEVSASQYTVEAGNWTTGDTGNQAAHSYERQTSDQGKRAQESTMQTFNNQSGNPVEVFSRSSHRQSDSSSLHGDAQNVGLEESMRRARRPF